MARSKAQTLQDILVGFAALVMVALLVFLYLRTESVNLTQQNEIASLLRELRNIDTHWDLEVLRARVEIDGSQGNAGDRSAAMNSSLSRLTNALKNISSPAVQAGLPEVSTQMRQKAALVKQLRSENASARKGLDELSRNSLAVGHQAVLQLKTRPPALDAILNRISTSAPLYFLLGEASQREVIETALEALPQAVTRLSGDTQEKADQAREGGLALIQHKQAELELSKKVEAVSPGVRIDAMTFAFNRELEEILQEKDLYRIYLIYYAAALILILGYLGFQLKSANARLERRVEERTRDLSEALRHLKESEAQLIQSEKMSSLGQMVAGVAHEINTPLAYVKNSLGTVADRLPALGQVIDETERLLTLLQSGANVDAERLSRQFALVAGKIAELKKRGLIDELSGLVKDGVYGTGQMAEIVGNLKDFSRLDRSKVTQFNLNTGLESTLLLAKHVLKTMTVKKTLGEIPDIVCSPSQINQVFLNLVTNAAQAMESRPGAITITSRSEADGVAVEVADDGPGIAPDVLPKIFDPFFSTKEIGKGTGLGLSISYKIVQQHGGRITVDSPPGKGARFTVWLPLQPPPDATPA